MAWSYRVREVVWLNFLFPRSEYWYMIFRDLARAWSSKEGKREILKRLDIHVNVIAVFLYVLQSHLLMIRDS